MLIVCIALELLSQLIDCLFHYGAGVLQLDVAQGMVLLWLDVVPVKIFDSTRRVLETSASSSVRMKIRTYVHTN
jgi:hypothetical protein